MSLDYQKTVYTNYTHRPDTRLKKTSYGNMNRWHHHPELFGNFIKCDIVQEVDEREVRRLLLSQMQKRGEGSQGRLDKQAVKDKYPTWGMASGSRPQGGDSYQLSSAYRNVVPHIPNPGLYDDQGVPELPRLGRDMKTGSQSMTMPHDPENPVHLGYYKSGGYDDAHKSSIKLMQKGVFPAATNGPRLLRAGRMGAAWRHTKEVMQAGGKRHMFIDGVVTQDDFSRLNHILKTDHIPTSLDYGNHFQGSRQSNRQKPQNYSSVTVLHDPTVQKGTEKNNWFIMR